MIWNTGIKSSLVTPSQIRMYTLPSPRKNPKIHAILMGIGLKDDCDSEGIGIDPIAKPVTATIFSSIGIDQNPDGVIEYTQTIISILAITVFILARIEIAMICCIPIYLGPYSWFI